MAVAGERLAQFEVLLDRMARAIEDRRGAADHFVDAPARDAGERRVDRHARLSDDASEILADFGTIATSRLEVEGGASDEQAFADVLDFVRVAVARLHRETGESRRAATRSLH